MSTLRVVVNGDATTVQEGVTVADIVAQTTHRTTGVAVAVNDEVVSRSRWQSTAVHAEDRIELLTAAPGG